MWFTRQISDHIIQVVSQVCTCVWLGQGCLGEYFQLNEIDKIIQSIEN